MARRKRIYAWMLCLVIALVLFASSAYIAHEANHDCAGNHCEICENVARMEALLHSFAALGAVLIFLFSLPAFLRAFHVEEGLCACHAPTLVSWKVRLNN